jgi:hypothetical protein
MDANKDSAPMSRPADRPAREQTSVALDETPSPQPTGMGPTQIVDPVWGQHNNPATILNFVETHIVEL